MSKKAHTSCQIRDSCIWKGKIKFLRIFDLVLLENICIINEQSFFTPFAIQFSSINTQHHSQHHTRNPSSKHNPYFAKFFQELPIFEFYSPALSSLSQALKRVLRVSMSKFASKTMIKTS